MRLPSPQMTDGVDKKRRIQYGECTSNTGEEKITGSIHHAIEEKTDETCIFFIILMNWYCDRKLTLYPAC